MGISQRRASEMPLAGSASNAIALCAKSSEPSSVSNNRRERIRFLRTCIGDGLLIFSNPARALKHCVETLEPLELEDEPGMLVHSIYYDAFQICVAHSDLARAVPMAKLAAKLKVECWGEDADGIDKLCSLIKTPNIHRLAGTSTWWRLGSEKPKNPIWPALNIGYRRESSVTTLNLCSLILKVLCSASGSKTFFQPLIYARMKMT